MAMEVTQVLLSAQSPDADLRKHAEESLKQFEGQNLPLFLLSLSAELANSSKPVESRRLAGLILKNSLDAKDAQRKQELVQKWLALDASIKSQIKAALMQTLASSATPEASHTAAQVIAKVGGIEIPQRQWPELIGQLLGNMSNPSTEIRRATLEALGYVCEEISSNVLAQEQVNSILTAVVQGMNNAESSPEVRLSATKALCNALDFAHTNFENDVERNYIMRMIFEAAGSGDVRVRQAAFECLVSIASTYYEKLDPYMPNIFTITSKAVKEDEEPVAMQAIEFWSAICDEEIEIQEEISSGYSGDSELPYFHFIKKALSHLVPMLLATMTKQEEDQEQDDDTWNLSMAGGCCLGLVARAAEDDIVPLVMPFIQENIGSQDWRSREAATYAFGSIIEGPSLDKLAPLVSSALPFLLNALKDQNSSVKDTTAWTLGRIFEFLHGPTVETSVINREALPHVLANLLESLNDAPNVADRTCGALYYLAQGYEEVSSQPSPLSPYYQNIVEALIRAADREDAGDSRLRVSAYETLNEVVRCSSEDTAQIVIQLASVIMQKLSGTLQMQVVSSDDRERQGEVQALLCGVLQVITQKLSSFPATKPAVIHMADQMMSLFLRVFECRSATVHEEAMLAIGALAYATGAGFEKYMQEFSRYLEMGLQNYEEYQVCSITVGVVGDICRALEEKILTLCEGKFCDGIMAQLLKDLSSNQLHRSVKPPIFSCFGDIALAIGESFEKYLAYALPMLQEAARVSAQQALQDPEMIDYNNQLRTGILEAYSGILQGFKGSPKAEMMLQSAAPLLQFIESVYLDKERDEGVNKAAVGVLGDLADTLGAGAAGAFRQFPYVKKYLEEAQQLDDAPLRDTSQWALAMINKITS